MKCVNILIIILLSFNCINAQKLDSLNYVEALLAQALKLEKIDTTEGQDLFQKALRIAERHDYTKFLAKTRLAYGNLLFKSTFYHRALGSYLKARNYYELLNDSIKMAESTLKIALTHEKRGNLRFATRELIDAVKQAEKLGLYNLSAEANEHLGLVYFNLQKPETAIPSYRKSLSIKEKLNDHSGYINMCMKLSEAYLDLGRVDSSIFFANEIIKRSDEKQFREENLSALILITQGYLLDKNLTSAKINIDKLHKYLEDETNDKKQKKRGNTNVIYKIYTLSGNYFLLNNDQKNTEFWHNKALALAENAKYPEILVFHFKTISETYKTLGDYDRAFEYQQKHIDALRTMMNSEDLNNVKQVENLYNKKESEDEIKWLNATNRLKELQLIRQAEKAQNLFQKNLLMDSLLLGKEKLSAALNQTNEYLEQQLINEKKLQAAQSQKLDSARKLRSTLIGFLILSLCFVAFSYYMYKKQADKNIVIEKQAEEVNYLMKEIHHRVKNNLQVVSSMLNLQSHYIKDADAVNAVKDSKNRVLSMALIHQRLYQDDDFRALDVSEYLELLTQSLINSYNVDTSRIKIKLDIEKLKLRDDTIMPIGLILNELITNSIKYAFPDERTGCISIKLYNENKNLVILVSDDGIGLNNKDGLISTNSFGHKMINSFLQKLKATMQIKSENGTSIQIIIPNTNSDE